MACPTMTFSGVTADVWNCLSQRASSLGVTLPGSSGGVEYLDAGVNYTWDQSAQTLTVTITHLPLIINCGTAESYLRQAVVGCGGH